MKRVGNLYDDIISIENLYLAEEKASRGKKNTYGVKIFNENRDENIQKLHEELKNKTFKTSPYKVSKIYEPKERIIYKLPYYPDRIVHHAIMNILEPIWLSVFTYNTYSCIKNRGISACAKQVDKIIKRYKGKKLYCLKLDIKKFYPSINHEIMKLIIRKKIKDVNLLWLLDEIIDSTDGLPIGNYISQYLANLFLAYFMHWVNEKLHKIIGIEHPIECVEYADDVVLFSEDKEVLHKAIKLIISHLKNKLNLTVKDNWQIFPISKNKYDKHGRALDYVGFKFYMEQKLLRNVIKKNLCKKCKQINNKNYSFKDYKIAIAPWIGWVKYSNSKHLLKTNINNEEYYSVLRHQALAA